MQVIAKNTQQDLGQKDNQKETDTFTARFQEHPITPITISIEKDLIPALDGSDKLVGIPNKIIISSGGDSVTTTSQELGGKMQAYIGEGELNTINFNLNKLVPKKLK